MNVCMYVRSVCVPIASYHVLSFITPSPLSSTPSGIVNKVTRPLSVIYLSA